jgi:hypothetical protein
MAGAARFDARKALRGFETRNKTGGTALGFRSRGAFGHDVRPPERDADGTVTR